MKKKPAEIEQLFTQISPRYDLANRFLSLGQDRRWRRHLIQTASPQTGERILDVCTGTADLMLDFHRENPDLNLDIYGLDFSWGMLQHGAQKINQAISDQNKLLVHGDALRLPFSNSSFDIVSIAFGLRNLSDYRAGLAEFIRVLNTGGRLLVLEFSQPSLPLWWSIYLFYLRRLLPTLGGWISGHREAYQYLPDSIRKFPVPQEIVAYLNETGFSGCTATSMLGGAVMLYRGEKTSS